MTTAIQPAGQAGTLERSGSSGLAEVVDTILDKGLVIDAYVSAAVVGIEILTINARIVVAGVDTYLRFAEAVNRLDLSQTRGEGLPELVQGTTQAATKGKAKGVATAALEAAGDKLRDFATRSEQQRQPDRQE